jgi:hypothetical protein
VRIKGITKFTSSWNQWLSLPKKPSDPACQARLVVLPIQLVSSCSAWLDLPAWKSSFSSLELKRKNIKKRNYTYVAFAILVYFNKFWVDLMTQNM